MGSRVKIAGKVFVVTGAGNGMGRELTLELVRRGAQVAAVDIREQALAETKSLAGSGVETFTLDITNSLEVAALPARVLKVFGAIDDQSSLADTHHSTRRITA
jgi:NAD(P)-dependent dehydrogenase (short-subunit alcohol dehydrogenase family)